jgi:Integrase zinc binding domain/Integrase core domain
MDNDLHTGLKGYLATASIPAKTPQEFHTLIKKTAPRYTLIKNTLYKLEESRQGTLGTTRGRQHRNLLIVPPRHQVPPLFKNYHDHHLAGHQAKENTYQKIAERYYWPGMKKDVTEYVQTCKICQKRSRQKGEAPLNPIVKNPNPLYQVGIDVVGPLPRTLTGYRYIVVAVDHFTKWPEARALTEADAQSIVRFLYEDIICRHGVPTILSSDQGTEFVNEMITALTDVYKISHIKTTTYHPQGNGQVERTNQTLKNILAKITPASGDWSHYLPSALSVIRNTRQASTKFSPSELLYGYPMRHHFDQEESEPADPKDPEEYALEEFTWIREFRSQASQFIKRAQDRQKRTHDSKVQALLPLQIGDLVLVWQTAVEVDMSAKLKPKYKGPYYVHRVKGTTYWLKNKTNGTLHPKPYHRNLLKAYQERSVTSSRQPVVEVPARRSPPKK